jgi:hypothetical protein
MCYARLADTIVIAAAPGARELRRDYFDRPHRHDC